MTALTWRNVDTPDFGSAITGVNNATRMLSNALESASSGLDKYKSLDAEAADRAIALRMLSYQDPAAYRKAIESGAIVGPDAARVSTGMLKNIDERVGTLADNAFAAERAEKLRYDSARGRESDALWDAAQADANAATREAAAGRYNRADEIIAGSQAIANLRQEQANNLLTDVQGRGTGRITQDTSLHKLKENRYDFGEKTSLDADTKAARDFFRRDQPYIGVPEDALAYRSALESNPNVNSRTLSIYDKLMDEHLQRGIRGVSAEGGGTGYSAPSGSTGIVSGNNGSFINAIDFPETKNYVTNITKNAGQVSGTNREKAIALLPHLIKQESGGNDAAVSSKGARGRTQVMPATGTDPGFGVKPMQNQTPQEYERFTTDYLTAMLDRYGGDVEKALAAYNGGFKNVDRWQSVIGPNQTRNLQADSTTIGLLERGAQNQVGGITPEQYTAALQDTQSSDFDVANKLVTDESSPYFGADVGEVTEFIKGARQRLGTGDSLVSPAVIGEILRRNAVQADNPLERGLSMLADVATGRFLQGRTRTPNIGSRGMRIDDEAVYADIERARTGKLATQAESSRILGANAQALQAARDSFNRVDSRYKAVLAASRSNPKLKASVQNLKQQRDQALENFNRVNATVANTPELQPQHRRTILSNLNIPFRETDDAQLLREYWSRPK